MKRFGVDVSQMGLEIWDGERVFRLANDLPKIRAWLRRQGPGALICEPTSSYHLALASAARMAGWRVYLVNPKQARNYKNSRSFRAKTDRLDAEFLYEFLLRHEDDLRPWQPVPAQAQALRAKLRAYRSLEQAHTSLRQSLGALQDLPPSAAQVLEQLQKAKDEMLQQMTALASACECYPRVRSLPGVGPVSGVALTYLLEGFDFASPEALTAFVGLDLRVSDSGRSRGRRRLTKRGDPLLRHALGMAGWALLLSKAGRNKKLQLKARGHSTGAQMAIAARKLLKVAWHLHQSKTTFDASKWAWKT